MIKLAILPMNPFGENTYILSNPEGECIVVDAGMSNVREQERFKAYIDQHHLRPILALNTHGHIDHISGVQWLKDTYGVPFALHAADLPILDAAPSYADMLGFAECLVPKVEQELTEGDELPFGIKVIHTPGHTAGGVCLWIEAQKMLLTGDTLFKESIGRTDLPSGSYDALMCSIVGKILPLGSDVTFFPGHGPQSTLGFEMERNPFITEAMSGDAKFRTDAN